MSDGTRRVFLSRSGLGVAAVGVAALAPAAVLSAHDSDSVTASTPGLSTASGSLIAFVHDVRATEVSLMVGEDEIVVQDKELVSRLLRAAAK